MKPLSKPAKKKEPEPKPGVTVDDHVYFHHGDKPCHGRVLATGRHGITVDHEGKRRQVYWDKVLGHKKRAVHDYELVDKGEDGMIVRDARGKQVYVEGEMPEEEDGYDVLEKSISMLKALKNAPGLSLQDVTDKRGHMTKRWKRTSEKPGSGRLGAHNVAAGDHVSFTHKNAAHKGHVVATGHDGATVRHADTGEHHRVLWHEMHGHEKAPAKPQYADRSEGETDKEYAKRVVDKTESPETLPEVHSRYFNTEGSTHVDIDKLHSTKSDKENQQGGDNGPKRMLAAYHGVLGKRDPIMVMPHAEKDGHYEVVDGNGTLTSAKKLGWKGLPVKVVSREQGQQYKAEDAAKELFKKDEIEKLPRAVTQPIERDGKDELYRLAGEAHKEMEKALTGLGSDLGLTRMTGLMEDTDWSQKGGMLFIAPLKGEKRAKEKVDADYGGDWSKLVDVVRASIAVDTLDDMRGVLDAMKAAGIEMAAKPKNRFANPTDMGYRDLLTRVKFKNGTVGELQIHLKPILKAKSEGHHAYQVTRTLQGKYGSEEPTDAWSSEDHEAFYKAKTEQQKLYSEAWREATIGGESFTKSHCDHKMIVLFGAGGKTNDLHRKRGRAVPG